MALVKTTYGGYGLMSFDIRQDGTIGMQQQTFNGYGNTVNAHIPPPMLYPSDQQYGHWGPNGHAAQPYHAGP